MSEFTSEQRFYNDSVVLLYDDKLHQYTVQEQGERYIVPSATGVCAMIDKSGPLMPWAAKMVVEYIAARAVVVDFRPEQDAGYFLFNGVETTQKGLDNFLLEAKRNFRTISEDALDIGSLAHDWLEAYTKALIDGVAYNAPLPANDKACKAITSALDWHKAHNFRPIAAEQKVYSKKLNTAGTFDWIAIIDSCKNEWCCKQSFKDKLVLGDYKSSKAIYDEYKIQTAFYKFAVEEHARYIGEILLSEIHGRVILRLGKEDGEFSSLILLDNDEYESDIDAFIGALSIYNWKQQISMGKKEDRLLTKSAKVKSSPKKVRVPKQPSIEVVSS